mmetsp:Transcript_13773/g.19287  ORF Transcript_13773/g.19287 Transcript_13773/m.19287 type:complete len:394 (+) Transcript_13773:72-1253(+)
MRDPSLCRSKDLGPMMRSKQHANSHQQRCRKSSLTDAGRSYSFPPRKMAQSRLRRWDGGTQQASPQLGEGTNFSPNGNASHSEAVCGNKKYGSGADQTRKWSLLRRNRRSLGSQIMAYKKAMVETSPKSFSYLHYSPPVKTAVGGLTASAGGKSSQGNKSPMSLSYPALPRSRTRGDPPRTIDFFNSQHIQQWRENTFTQIVQGLHQTGRAGRRGYPNPERAGAPTSKKMRKLSSSLGSLRIAGIDSTLLEDIKAKRKSRKVKKEDEKYYFSYIQRKISMRDGAKWSSHPPVKHDSMGFVKGKHANRGATQEGRMMRRKGSNRGKSDGGFRYNLIKKQIENLVFTSRKDVTARENARWVKGEIAGMHSALDGFEKVTLAALNEEELRRNGAST